MWLFYLLLVIVVIAGGIYFWQNIRPQINARRNLALLGQEAPTLTRDGVTFRDLNKNGKLDPYEDPRQPIEERVEDLLKQMTLEEKAGLMFQTMIGMNPDGTPLEKTGFFPVPPTSDANRAAALESLQYPAGLGRASHGGVAQPRPETGGADAAGNPDHDLHRPAPCFFGESIYQPGRRHLLPIPRTAQDSLPRATRS